MVLATAGTRCTYNKWPEQPVIVVPDTISFNKQLIPLFTAYCTSSLCHNSNYKGNGSLFSLDSAVAYSSLLEPGHGYVVPGNAEYSILYQQVNTDFMPKNGPPFLSAAQIQEIYKWIQQGAKNN